MQRSVGPVATVDGGCLPLARLISQSSLGIKVCRIRTRLLARNCFHDPRPVTPRHGVGVATFLRLCGDSAWRSPRGGRRPKPSSQGQSWGPGGEEGRFAGPAPQTAPTSRPARCRMGSEQDPKVAWVLNSSSFFLGELPE